MLFRSLKSGLYIDLIIVKIDVSVSLKYENKWSIFDAGLEEPDFRYDLIFEDELKGKFKNEIASGQEFKDDLLFGDEFINFGRTYLATDFIKEWTQVFHTFFKFQVIAVL